MRGIVVVIHDVPKGGLMRVEVPFGHIVPADQMEQIPFEVPNRARSEGVAEAIKTRIRAKSVKGGLHYPKLAKLLQEQPND